MMKSSEEKKLQKCHNCRRNRLNCDGQKPCCLKCLSKAQDCLGYDGVFLRWGQGVASRGRRAGVFRFDEEHSSHRIEEDKSSLFSSEGGSLNGRRGYVGDREGLSTLSSPLVKATSSSEHSISYELSAASEARYLSYFLSDVCKDLVLYDVPQHNPFRELLPLAERHPVLLRMIIATSALHMSNARQKSGDSDRLSPMLRSAPSALSGSVANSTHFQQCEAYEEALAAKQNALNLLQPALENVKPTEIDVILAVVVLFIEFELLDTGKDDWKHHINGARTIIERFCGPNLSRHEVPSPLRGCLISNCLVFDILGSTLSCSRSSDDLSTGSLSLLQDAEGNHCSSFPAALLQIMRSTARLRSVSPSSINSPDSDKSGRSNASSTAESHINELLQTAYSFNPIAWATELQLRSPVNDLLHRTHIATAHHAAVCIYLARLLMSENPKSRLPEDTETLIGRVKDSLSVIQPGDALFTASAWPTFIAGAETQDSSTQEWVTLRFGQLWEVEPWGMTRGALGVLERIWTRRRENNTSLSMPKSRSNDSGDYDWIGDLRAKGVDWLIL